MGEGARWASTLRSKLQPRGREGPAGRGVLVDGERGFGHEERKTRVALRLAVEPIALGNRCLVVGDGERLAGEELLLGAEGGEGRELLEGLLVAIGPGHLLTDAGEEILAGREALGLLRGGGEAGAQGVEGTLRLQLRRAGIGPGG